MKIYSCNIGLGWGVVSQVLSSIRRQARQLGLELAPMGYAKAFEFLKAYEIKVSGEDAAVDKFEEWARKCGYDDREKTTGESAKESNEH